MVFTMSCICIFYVKRIKVLNPIYKCLMFNWNILSSLWNIWQYDFYWVKGRNPFLQLVVGILLVGCVILF